jgi:hypothetical protein
MFSGFPRGAVLVAAILISLGWMLWSGWLITAGILLFVAVLGAWARWRELVARSRLILGVEDRLARVRDARVRDTEASRNSDEHVPPNPRW